MPLPPDGRTSPCSSADRRIAVATTPYRRVLSQNAFPAGPVRAASSPRPSLCHRRNSPRAKMPPLGRPAPRPRRLAFAESAAVLRTGPPGRAPLPARTCRCRRPTDRDVDVPPGRWCRGAMLLSQTASPRHLTPQAGIRRPGKTDRDAISACRQVVFRERSIEPHRTLQPPLSAAATMRARRCGPERLADARARATDRD
jgi:hypothetical protein